MLRLGQYNGAVLGSWLGAQGSSGPGQEEHHCLECQLRVTQAQGSVSCGDRSAEVAGAEGFGPFG